AVALSLVIVSCSADPGAGTTTTSQETTTTEAETTTTRLETTTTTPETTTTTAPVVKISGPEGAGLRAVIKRFYAHARGIEGPGVPALAQMVPEPGSLAEDATVEVEVRTAAYGDGSIA